MTTSKGSSLRLVLALVPAITGLVASAMLLVDYLRPLPVFCDDGGGCTAVKRTALASLFGVPTPYVGVVAFAAFAVLSLLRGDRIRSALVVLAAVSAGLALVLIGVQVSMNRYCPFCMVADTSAVLVLAMAAWRAKAEWDPPASVLGRSAAGLFPALALAAPLSVGFSKALPVPEAIAKEIAATPDGQACVVDFVDFECPFCRQTHAELAPVLASHREQVHLVRRQVPLTRMHPHSLDAARAACCGETLGKGDAMADALFTAPIDDLTPEGCTKLAVSLGLNESTFRSCLQDPKTDARIEADTSEFKAAKGKGLPTIWIEQRKIEGLTPGEVFQEAVVSAIAQKG